MTKHKVTALALVLALAVLSPASALAKPGGTDRPVKGAGSGTISLDPQTGAFTGDAEGVSSHLGKYTVHLEGTGAPTPEANFSGSGTVTIVAANGDRMTGTFTLTTTGPTTTVVVTINDGTGRFADASGTLTVICLTSPWSQVGQTLLSEIECRMTGQISY
jgi:hypothetical protein